MWNEVSGWCTFPGDQKPITPVGRPDMVAYLTEEELTLASKDLENLGFEPQSFMIALTAPPSPVDYFHAFVRPR